MAKANAVVETPQKPRPFRTDDFSGERGSVGSEIDLPPGTGVPLVTLVGFGAIVHGIDAADFGAQIDEFRSGSGQGE